MTRFDPTGEVPSSSQHSSMALSWGVLRGAEGPCDGSLGAHTNVPSALAVLRHAPLYASAPQELEEAFMVLERHVMRDGTVYPVAVTVVPILFDIVRRGTPIGRRITHLLARYVRHAPTLEPWLAARLFEIIADHGHEVLRWIGRYDAAAAALAIHVPALRPALVGVLATATKIAPPMLLALVELGVAPGESIAIAQRVFDAPTVPEPARMAAAVFLARHGGRTQTSSAPSPQLAARIDAALPPTAAAVLERYLGGLWRPTIVRPAVAPRIHEATIVFVDKQLVLVRIGERTVTLPWADAEVQRGETINVGISAHGEPRLAIHTDRAGSVTVRHF
jgi:hypothetical protein